MAAKKAKKTRSAGTVGVVGLGIMGGAFAKHLLAAGYKVVGFDPEPARAREFARRGGTPGGSAAEVAASASILITSLPSVKALKAALLGRDGIAAGAKKGAVVVEASTFALADKEMARRGLAKAGVTMLDCPISGTGAQAAAKDILVYASGDRKAFNRCRKVFDGFARGTHYCGKFGTGSKLKYLANLLVAIHNLSAAEALVLAERAGVNLKLAYEVLKDGAGGSRMFAVRGPMMVRRTYGPATMKIDVWQKDMSVIGDFAKSLKCPTPLFSLSEVFYDTAYDLGYGQADTAVVHRLLRDLARGKRGR